jgi:hypothetical protein
MDHIQESKYYDYDSYSLFFFIKEPPTPLFTPKIELATLYTFDY